MQVASSARRAFRLLRQSPMFLNSNNHFLPSHHSTNPLQHTPFLSGITQRDYWHVSMEPMYFMMPKAFYSSGVETIEETPTVAVKELYDKMLESVKVKRSMPPNAWLWSMIENCKHQQDISLLFDILENLHIFRLSNLRIHDDFNSNLCQEVTKACIKAGALDFAKMTLWKHNVYGLSPTVAAANHLLTHAKNHNDTKLLVEVMKLLKKNDLPLQPGTADIVFSICYNTDKWDLINKYGKWFVKAGGVKLRQTSFDTWMKFAAKRGETEPLWKMNTLRLESKKIPTLTSGISCAKGHLLERNPSDAASIIQELNENLDDAKKRRLKDELQKLISEWPKEVIKYRKGEDQKTLASSLNSDILAMISQLNMGLEASLNLEDLKG
ncbi:hypothetical protein HN51_063736 [Arachis hypogaea]|uniref:Uncharacterized protein n=2 Tax=Arachis TaxID=3817 RepID=A0A445AX01_ARAHY|nr:uncharacterized protein LOC107638252 isoform X1 [Arachis ipaensis]XP_025630044.1 uncharacterized protein LOC112723043 isoform X1 [Arachis hypogaea]QHO21336.1 Adenylyl cyclase [Arachis hypogaea]RYR30958.1 hypothetical protein Ahy_B01g055751 [Arachis hypogaea]